MICDGCFVRCYRFVYLLISFGFTDGFLYLFVFTLLGGYYGFALRICGGFCIASKVAFCLRFGLFGWVLCWFCWC